MIISIGIKFKNWLGLAQQEAGQIFYNSLQTYKVRYGAVIKNTAREDSSFYVILPIPPDTPYQKILKEPQFFPREVSIGQDSVFGNKYVYWKLDLTPGATETVREEFIVQVEPRVSSSKDNLVSYDLVNSTKLSFVDADDPRIRKLAARLKGNETDAYKIVQKFNEFVISRLEYGNPLKGLYSSKDALEKSKVDCGGFDTLLAALCVSTGIPARIVCGFWAGYPQNDMHAWLEIMLPDGKWIPADPSVEHLRRRKRTKKSGELGFVGSDRIVLSVGCEIPIIISQKSFCADILQTPIVLTEKGKDSFTLETRFATMTSK